jgi:hypothetical protein
VNFKTIVVIKAYEFNIIYKIFPKSVLLHGNEVWKRPDKEHVSSLNVIYEMNSRLHIYWPSKMKK